MTEFDNSLYCYAADGASFGGAGADFSGGIKTSITGDYNQEYFMVDCGTRGDSAIPRSIVEKRGLIVHHEPRDIKTAGGPASSPGYVIIYVKLDLREFNLGYKVGRMRCSTTS